MNKCSVCIDPRKGENCVGTCSCDTCSKASVCYKHIRPTIRVTKTCTQSCSHCCFSCSPAKTEKMTIQTATTIADFLRANEIRYINLMGGEVWLNPDWIAILSVFAFVAEIRVVTNGDSVVSCPEFFATIAKHKNMKIAISNDKWHTNANVEEARQQAEALGIRVTVGGDEEGTTLDDDGLVPVGRMRFGAGNVFDMFASYCQRPQNRYSILINEEGTIFKCPFERFEFDHVADYLEPLSFNQRFKDFGTRFHAAFIPSCLQCDRIHARYLEKYRKVC